MEVPPGIPGCEAARNGDFKLSPNSHSAAFLVPMPLNCATRKVFPLLFETTDDAFSIFWLAGLFT
jgi:hypothetical protein